MENTSSADARIRDRQLAVTLAADPVRQAPDAGSQAVVAQLIAALDPDRRAAFVLTQLLGCSYAEAAAVCECPIGTIRSRVARAREDLDAMTSNPGEIPRTAPASGTRN